MTQINQYNLIDQLRSAFPEIEGGYKEVCSRDHGPPGNYFTFGLVVEPYLHKELAKGQITDFTSRFAAFMEKVCTSGDSEAINVIWLEIFPLLLTEPRGLKLLWPILGSCTRSNVKDAARRWGKLDSLLKAGIWNPF